MVGESDGAGNAASNEAPATKQTRQRSTIEFPYMDLGAVLPVAEKIHENVGHGDCDDAQLAVWLGLSPTSSGFRDRIYTARKFGIIANDGGRHKLTPLGQAIVDPHRARQGKADAFLNVPLFKAIFDKYKGSVLPPAAALERDIASLGVADKQKQRARQTLEQSANAAGFFEHGRNRLVMPGVAQRREAPTNAEVEPKSEVENGKRKQGGGGDGNYPDLHPFIQGLLKTLPSPEGESGEKRDWPLAQRVKWLQTAANIFDLIYEGEGGIDVKAAMATRSPRPNEQ